MAATNRTIGTYQVPNEWQRNCLEEVVDVLDSRRVPLGAAVRAQMAGEYPYYGANGLLDHIDSWIFDEDDDLILLAEDGGHFDDYRTKPIAYRVTGKCWVNNHAHVLIAKPSNDRGFIYGSLENKDIRPFINGTTRSKLTQADLLRIEIALPPLPEQRAIAAVLDSIDDAIEGAEAVIAATEGLRDALLHDLLTRGLPGLHTEFRDVPGLGTIPADWDVARLGDVATVTSGLAMGPHRIPQNNPRPYITVANVQTNQITIDINRLMEVSESEYQSRTLQAGDVVLVEGHAQISQLGRAAIVPPEAEGFTFQNHLFRVRTGELSDARFVAAYVNGHEGRRYFGSFGGTTSGLNKVSAANVQALPLPLPSLSEQHHIASMLDGLDIAIDVARQELAGLRLLKKSTADALMTGRVRVATKG